MILNFKLKQLIFHWNPTLSLEERQRDACNSLTDYLRARILLSSWPTCFLRRAFKLPLPNLLILDGDRKTVVLP